jgi:hypothetical protein
MFQEFINFLNGIDVLEYSQSCKGKSTTIIGFIWVNNNEIVFVTDHGIEQFQVKIPHHFIKLFCDFTSYFRSYLSGDPWKLLKIWASASTGLSTALTANC